MAFWEVKNTIGPSPKLCYRSDEYKVLQKHRRYMKRQLSPIKENKKSRKERDARFYQKKMKRIKEMEAEKKRAAEDILERNKTMKLNELEMLKD